MTQPVLDIQQLHLSFPGFNGDVHAAFRACLQAPIEHEALSSWRDLSRIIEQRMLAIYNEDAAARQLILAQHGLIEVTRADRQHPRYRRPDAQPQTAA